MSVLEHSIYFKGPTSEDAWWGGVWHHNGAKEETCDVQCVPKLFTLMFFEDRPQFFLQIKSNFSSRWIHLPNADGICRLKCNWVGVCIMGEGTIGGQGGCVTPPVSKNRHNATLQGRGKQVGREGNVPKYFSEV